jgi:hypothetical protein
MKSSGYGVTRDWVLAKAAHILKMTQDEFLDMAQTREISPPSADVWRSRLAEIDAKMMPIVRTSERNRVERCLRDALIVSVDARDGLTRFVLDPMTSIVAGRSFSAAQTKLSTAIELLSGKLFLVAEGRAAEMKVEPQSV